MFKVKDVATESTFIHYKRLDFPTLDNYLKWLYKYRKNAISKNQVNDSIDSIEEYGLDPKDKFPIYITKKYAFSNELFDDIDKYGSYSKLEKELIKQEKAFRKAKYGTKKSVSSNKSKMEKKRYSKDERIDYWEKISKNPKSKKQKQYAINRLEKLKEPIKQYSLEEKKKYFTDISKNAKSSKQKAWADNKLKKLNDKKNDIKPSWFDSYVKENNIKFK